MLGGEQGFYSDNLICIARDWLEQQVTLPVCAKLMRAVLMIFGKGLLPNPRMSSEHNFGSFFAGLIKNCLTLNAGGSSFEWEGNYISVYWGYQGRLANHLVCCTAQPWEESGTGASPFLSYLVLGSGSVINMTRSILNNIKKKHSGRSKKAVLESYLQSSAS